MADQTEKLVLLLEAQNKDVLRKLNQVERQTRRTFQQSEKHAKGFNLQLRKSANAAKILAASFTGGLAGGVIGGGLGSLPTLFREAASAVSEMSAEARRAGVGVEVFQELTVAAEAYRVSQDALVDGLKEMQLRADEFVTTGGGGGADAFQRLGYGADELAEKLKDPSDLFLEILERMRQLKGTAGRIRVSDEVFGGTGGEQFVQMLKASDQDLRTLMGTAKDSGKVLDAELVATFESAERSLESFTDYLSNNFLTAWGATLRVLGAKPDIGSLPISYIEEKIKELEQHKADIESGLVGLDPRSRRSELQDVTQDLQAYTEALENAQQAETTTSSTSSSVSLPQSKPVLSVNDVDPKYQARQQNAAAADTEADAVDRVIASLEEEYQALGMSATAQRVANELRAAGIDEADDQASKIRGLVEQLEQAYQAEQTVYDVAQFGGSLLIDALTGGEDAAQRLTQALAEAALQAAILGQGPLASLFGTSESGGLAGTIASALLPHYASGTQSAPGGLAVVGEQGPEVVDLPAGSTVIPNHRLGGDTVQYSPSYVIDARGSTMTESQFRKILEENNRKAVPQIAVAAVGRANRINTSSRFRRT